MKFIDQAKIHVNAGNGGHGCIAFLREKFRPKGGPCGGDGGNGGSIILKVNPQLMTLHDISYQRHYKAENGQHGGGKNMRGKNGKNLFIELPMGTIIRNHETQQEIIDLTNEDSTFEIVKGGNGGFGNARFKTQNQNAPRIANDGQIGEEISIELELKVMADVGLVGFPNAGKSTYISRISNAKPKIADYPFTTLVPNLGIVKYGDFQSFVMADIPGLIEGASQGKGLGSQFLRHIERTRMLVFIVDAASEDINTEYQTLVSELRQHDKTLLSRPKLLLLSKIDTITDSKDSLTDLPKDIEIIKISSVSGNNINKSILKIAKQLESLNEIKYTAD